jgi:hypothetical protein
MTREISILPFGQKQNHKTTTTSLSWPFQPTHEDNVSLSLTGWPCEKQAHFSLKMASFRWVKNENKGKMDSLDRFDLQDPTDGTTHGLGTLGAPRLYFYEFVDSSCGRAQQATIAWLRLPVPRSQSVPVEQSLVPDPDISFPIDLSCCSAADSFLFSIVFRPVARRHVRPIADRSPTGDRTGDQHQPIRRSCIHALVHSWVQS